MNTIVKIAKNTAVATVTAGMLCLGSAAQAATPSWIYNVKVVNLLVQPNKFIQVTVQGAEVPGQECNLNDGKTLELNPTAPHYEQQYTLLMAALVAKQNVAIYVSGCANIFPKAEVISVSSM